MLPQDIKPESSSATEDFTYTEKQSGYLTQNLEYYEIGKDRSLVSDFVKCQGDNPTLQRINLQGHSMELMSFLSTFRNLTIINLSHTQLGEAGSSLAQSIKSSEDESPLRELSLNDCSLPTTALLKFVTSLSKCKHLTILNLSGNILREVGHELVQSIRSWGNDPPLQQLFLHSCSLPVHAAVELAKSLSTCRKLTHLDLGMNNLGEAGNHLVIAIRSWFGLKFGPKFGPRFGLRFGPRFGLKLARGLARGLARSWLKVWPEVWPEVGPRFGPRFGPKLYDCSISGRVIRELLKSLSTCKSLTHLNLGKNLIGTAGYNLAQSITYWGNDAQFQELILKDCQMPLNVSSEVLDSLWACKRITTLDLSGNILDESGLQLAESIRFWGDDSPLQRLYLDNCSMPADVWNELFQALLVCRNLNEFDAPENILNKVGYDIPKVFIFLMQQQLAKIKFAEVNHVLTYDLNLF